MNGETLLFIRKALGLTQQELADKLNVRHSTVNRWESGKQGIQPENMRRLQELLNFTDEDLQEIDNLLLEQRHKRLKAKLRSQARL